MYIISDYFNQLFVIFPMRFVNLQLVIDFRIKTNDVEITDPQLKQEKEKEST